MPHAVDNRDPFTGQKLLSRGIVGTRGDTPAVASPLLEQVVDRSTGALVPDESVRIDVPDVRVRDGVVEVHLRSSAGST